MIPAEIAGKMSSRDTEYLQTFRDGHADAATSNRAKRMQKLGLLDYVCVGMRRRSLLGGLVLAALQGKSR